MAKSKKEKKSSSNILVVLLILILLLLIILPPTFRSLFPREEEEENTTETPKLNNLTNLSCRKKTTDNYNVTVNNIYQNNDISKVTISYTPVVNNQNTTETTDGSTNNNETSNATTNTEIQTTDTTNQPQANTEQTTTSSPVIDNVLAEMEILRGIDAVTKNETDTNHQFLILIKNFGNLPIPNEITFRLQSLTVQKKFYENMGYTCTIVNT